MFNSEFTSVEKKALITKKMVNLVDKFKISLLKNDLKTPNYPIFIAHIIASLLNYRFKLL